MAVNKSCILLLSQIASDLFNNCFCMQVLNILGAFCFCKDKLKYLYKTNNINKNKFAQFIVVNYICTEMIEQKNLRTIKNFAALRGCKPTYIYRLIRSKEISYVEIDGVKFIDITKNKP